MRAPSSAAVPALFVLLMVAGWSSEASAQLIGLKTVPIAAGEQFFIHPSLNAAMGAPGLALGDELLDPFVNPAKGSRTDEPAFFAAPMAYSISNDNGGVATLPLGALFSGDRWFGGGLVAFQDVDVGQRFQPFFERDVGAESIILPRQTLQGRSATNKFAQGVAGRTFADGRYSLGLSVLLADLNGIDGVEHLFANAWEIEEYGHMKDLRLGATANLEGDRTLEAVLLYNRFDMTHDVTSVTWELTDAVSWRFTPSVRVEENLNKTSTWGAHLGYVAPLGETHWRVGFAATANRKNHPKIPTYELEVVSRIPRDPGNSWAYNLGVGLSYLEGPTTFAMDIVYEPATSHTWADSETDVTSTSGAIIPAGDPTIENWFTFSNAAARLGLSHEIDEAMSFQIGVRTQSYDYRLRQTNHVEVSKRAQLTQWTEWTPSWGLRADVGQVELRYTGFASSASHFPFPSLGSTEVLNPGSIQDAGDILAAPDQRVVPPNETIVTHRLAISVPIR